MSPEVDSVKCQRISIRLHGVIFQKTLVFIITVMRASNVTQDTSYSSIFFSVL